MKKIKVAQSTIQSIEIINSFIEAIIESEFPDTEMQGLIDVTSMMVSFPLSELKSFMDNIKNALIESPNGIIVEEVDMEDEYEKAEYYAPISRNYSQKDIISMMMLSLDPKSFLKNKGINPDFIEEAENRMEEERKAKNVSFSKPKPINPDDEDDINNFLDNILKGQ